ncbi:hypothetical protein EPUS_06274 [Endocarpon pusillum Z07020]|uniref:Phosphoribosylaminoimidazole-succinocarboxamide synthase n=1 Tax=Endocarpon pusillum (strain Z07020 / HMAS-L-300199) TaxID=1263415 RepID=U1HFF4_ENDPU|nr:uncharacterized protein EPUS_06274 [Endocarpon pusillum Z07020]ERF68830.1 hypothetical protein EPUS_06274 [Endocarpon pusillum Z07020]
MTNDQPLETSGTSSAGLPGVIMAEDQQRSDYVFRPVSVPKGYPELKYKPIMLSFRCMLCVLTFYLIVLGLLITLIFVHNVSFSSQYGYFTIRILPPIIGTITASLWRTIVLTVSRIEPFIASASDDPTVYNWQNSAHRTILAEYFPVPEIFNMIRNRNGLLTFTYILWVLSNAVLAFKAVLLNTTNYDDYWEAAVTFWALYALISIYFLLIVGLVALMWHLRAVTTGLLWDPVSIADHLVLFHHSNFLAKFDGTGAISRDSLHERFRRNDFRLKYWDRGSLGIWHGFGVIEHDLHGSVQRNAPGPAPAPISTASEPNPADSAQSRLSALKAESSNAGTTATLSMQEVSKASYRSCYYNMERSMMVIWTTVALVLFCLLLAAAITNMASGIDVSLPYGVTLFLFQFLPAFVVGLYTWFWEDADVFCRATQPFIGMRDNPKPATENILLDYTCLPPGIATYTAFTNKHWKVARVSAISLLQRLLPIIIPGMVTVVDGKDHRTVYVSIPLLIVSLIYLGSYIILIPFEVCQNGLKRHLPRNYSAIADLISWCYASSLLRSDAFELSWRKRNDAPGYVYERWQMEAALRLKHHSYQFGVYKSQLNPGTHCIGFDEANQVDAVDLPDKRSLRRRRRRASHGRESQMKWEMSKLTWLDASKERATDPTTTQLQFRMPRRSSPQSSPGFEGRSQVLSLIVLSTTLS